MRQQAKVIGEVRLDGFTSISSWMEIGNEIIQARFRTICYVGTSKGTETKTKKLKIGDSDKLSPIFSHVSTDEMLEHRSFVEFLANTTSDYKTSSLHVASVFMYKHHCESAAYSHERHLKGSDSPQSLKRDAVHMAAEAWANVKETTLKIVWNKLCPTFDSETRPTPPEEPHEWLEGDEDDPSYELVTDDYIIAQVQGSEDDIDEDDDQDDDNVLVEKSPTNEEAN
ncbi:hypothetical protein J6590_003919 [Homalodisca vitripennis]|nr:hypothetical protein J6590_003919 [Homalodisca vitripennis]